MPWIIEELKKRQWYQSPVPWIGLGIAAALGFLALPQAQRAYHHWSENRRVVRAETTFANREYEQAIVDAKAVLALNPQSVEATRIIAKSLEALNSPQALVVRRHLDALTGSSDVENGFAIVAGYWKADDLAGAEGALKDLPPVARETARYHEFAGRIAVRRQDTAAALEHWQEAVRREPTNQSYAIELAATRLKSTTAGDRETALDHLNKLAANPATRSSALRTMIADDAARGETGRALELSTALSADPASTFADRLRHLGILHATRDESFAPFLAKLQESSADKPEQLYALLAWMNQNTLALAIPEWVAQLPPEVLALPQIRAALADTDAHASNWSGLKDRLESEMWAELDHLRLAHLSRALERLGDKSAALAAWTDAVAAAQANPRQLEILAKAVRDWGWNRKTEEVLWKLAASEFCPRWAGDFLWAAARKDADSTRLYEASRALLKADPKGKATRNNFVILSLLTGHDNDSPQEMAKTLYEQHPTDPFVASTYGLSFYQQGRFGEAVELMKRFTPEQLRQPPIALYQGIFLAGAGRFAEAQEYLAAGAKAPMLPEEKALFVKAQGGAPAAPAQALDRSRSDTAQLYRECRQAFLAEPKDVSARRNYVLLALLTEQSVDSARQLARALYKEHPTHPFVASIYGLSLCQQDKAEEAVALMETLEPEQLREPLTALYYGCALAGSGRAEKAAQAFALAEKAPLLPEERALISTGRAKGPTIVIPVP